MTLNDYQKEAKTTSVYPKQFSILYPALGLAGESGEVADKIKKIIRDKNAVFEKQDIESIAKEVGDVLWYVAIMADDLGFSLEEIAQMNINKLRSRKERNALSGSGDER